MEKIAVLNLQGCSKDKIWVNRCKDLKTVLMTQDMPKKPPSLPPPSPPQNENQQQENQSTLNVSQRIKQFQNIGMKVYNSLIKCRDKIVQNCTSFVRKSITILTHGYSKVVCKILTDNKNVDFKLIVTEGAPFGYGDQTINYLRKNGCTFTIEKIPDTAVAYKMKEVDFVLIWSQLLVRTGGSINSIGTYNIAIIAKHFNVPLYVAAECFKFSNSYPLEQKDVNLSLFNNPNKTIIYDYTPPEMISLVISDLAVFTPSAVADELIKFYG